MSHEHHNSISIKEISTAKELEQAHRIREQVLEGEQGFPHEINIDGLDPSASHVLMFDGDLPIATARLTISAEGVGRMARIAILPAYRGRGLGARLVRGIEKLGRRLGVETLEVEPHAHLKSFFHMLGFSEGAVPTPIQGHNLIRMTKRL